MKARFPELIALYGQNEFDNPVLQDASWKPLADLAAKHGLAKSEAHTPSTFEAEHLWFDMATPAHKLLLVGNSHSKDMFNALHQNPDLFDDLQIARFGMNATLRSKQIDRLLHAPNFKTADTIALAFRYTPRSIERLPELIEQIQSQGKDIVVFLNTVEFHEIEAKPIFDWYLQTHKGAIPVVALNGLAYEHRDESETFRLNAHLRTIATRYDLPIRDRADFICSPITKSCDVVTPGGYKVLYDQAHWSLEGARHFGRKIAETDWLGSL